VTNRSVSTCASLGLGLWATVDDHRRVLDHLLAAALERIPAIEPPPDTPTPNSSPEPRESPQTFSEQQGSGTVSPEDAGQEKSSWWKRVFGLE
jgi:hypothetical protein